jgi:hypothetical protein
MTGTHARETIITTIDAIHRVTGRAIRLAEVIRVGAASLEFHEETLATETEDHVELTKEPAEGFLTPILNEATGHGVKATLEIATVPGVVIVTQIDPGVVGQTVNR